MYYPTSWDPFFAEYMTLAQIYRYPTQHFRYHQRQLTLGLGRRDVMRLTIPARPALPTIPSPAISSILHLHRLSSMDDE